MGYELAVGEQSVSATVIDYADLHLDLSLGAITPAPQQLSTFPPDPYAGRTPPAAARCTYWFWSGTNAQPGTCCGGMTLIGSGTVTFAPGIYVIDGGLLVGGGNITVNGNGVTLYFTNGASFLFSGITTLNLTAPTSGSTAGIAVWFDRNDPSLILVGGLTTLKLTGAFYAPRQPSTWSVSSAITRASSSLRWHLPLRV